MGSIVVPSTGTNGTNPTVEKTISFAEVYSRINEQALELLQDKEEPENALDILK